MSLLSVEGWNGERESTTKSNFLHGLNHSALGVRQKSQRSSKQGFGSSFLPALATCGPFLPPRPQSCDLHTSHRNPSSHPNEMQNQSPKLQMGDLIKMFPFLRSIIEAKLFHFPLIYLLFPSFETNCELHFLTYCLQKCSKSKLNLLEGFDSFYILHRIT